MPPARKTYTAHGMSVSTISFTVCSTAHAVASPAVAMMSRGFLVESGADSGHTVRRV